MVDRASPLWAIVIAAVTLQVSAGEHHRTCRHLFRRQPSCCLIDDSPLTRTRCSARRPAVDRDSSPAGNLCLCHRVCERLGNCCPDYARMCPPPERRLQAWCPSHMISLPPFLDKLDGLPYELATKRVAHAQKSIWERQNDNMALAWRSLEYDFRTFGHDASVIGHENSGELEPTPNMATTGNGQNRQFHKNSVIAEVTYAFYSAGIVIKRKCAGTVIGPHHILTAAHCLFDRQRITWHGHVTVTTIINEGMRYEKRVQLRWRKMMLPHTYKVLAGMGDSDYGMIILNDELDRWSAFGAIHPLPRFLKATVNASQSTKASRCHVRHPFRSNNPVLVHNCTDSSVFGGSPLFSDHPNQRNITNEIVSTRPHSFLVRGMKTGEESDNAIYFDLCVFHTICGWMNSIENDGSSHHHHSEVFRRSLGDRCAGMRMFAPSLVQRHPHGRPGNS